MASAFTGAPEATISLKSPLVCREFTRKGVEKSGRGARKGDYCDAADLRQEGGPRQRML